MNTNQKLLTHIGKSTYNLVWCWCCLLAKFSKMRIMMENKIEIPNLAKLGNFGCELFKAGAMTCVTSFIGGCINGMFFSNKDNDDKKAK